MDKLVGSAMFMIQTDHEMWKHHLNQLQSHFSEFEGTGMQYQLE